EEAGEGQLVESRLVAPIRGEVCGEPLLDSPPVFPPALPPRTRQEAWTGSYPCSQRLSYHPFKTGQEQNLVFSIQKNQSGRKREPQRAEPLRDHGALLPRAAVVLIPQNEQRVGVVLRANEIRAFLDPLAQVKILPANRRSPWQGETQVFR